MNNNPLKTILVGASTTGKTTIVRRIISGRFFGQADCTIGASFFPYSSGSIKYEFWDTAGQERFNSLMPMYFKGAKILIFVFDVSSISSANDFERYVRIVYEYEKLKILIIGNKTDLITKDELKRVDTYVRDKFNDYGLSNRIFDFILISTKTGDNFEILKQTLDKCAGTIDNSTKPIVETDKSILLGVSEANKDEAKKCLC
jgi:Ras-related protein Rab-5C